MRQKVSDIFFLINWAEAVVFKMTNLMQEASRLLKYQQVRKCLS